MKRQLFPKLLCLFSVFLMLNFSSIAQNSYEPNKHLDTDFQQFNSNDFIENDNTIISLKPFQTFNSSFKNSTYFYYSLNNLSKGGIYANKEFSYKSKKIQNNFSALSLPSIQIQSNLFGQGLFYGFALTIIMLTFVSYFIFDEKLYLIFSLSVVSITMVLFYTESLLSMVGVTGVIPNQIMQSTLLFIAIGIFSLFASNYLSAKDYFPKLKNITIPLYGIATVVLAISWFSNNPLVSNSLNLILYSIVSIYFVAGVILFSTKNYAKFFVIATFIPLLFSIDFFVLRPLGIDFLFTKIIHLKVAVIFEVILLSYSILYRMKEVKEEIDLKQTEMRIFLKRQDVMSRNQVEKLVEDVYLENLIMQYDLNGLEIKLLQYISEGKTNVKIAKKLKITEPEVVDFTKELYQKLEISEHIQEDYRLVESQPDYIYN